MTKDVKVVQLMTDTKTYKYQLINFSKKKKKTLMNPTVRKFADLFYLLLR